MSSTCVAIIFFEDSLAFIKKVFGDDRLMFTDVIHSSPFHRTVIKRTFDCPKHFTHRHPLADGADESFLVEQVPNLYQGIVSGAVELEHFSDERCANRISCDDPFLFVVGSSRIEVSHRSFCRPPSVFIRK